MSYSLRLKRGITKKFKRLGLSLKKDALNKLLELHEDYQDDNEFDQMLDELGELTLSQKLSSPIISLNQIQPAIDQLINKDNNIDVNEENLLSLENAFDAKRFKYKAVGKQFFPVKNGPIHGSANDLSAVFIERYELLLQRTLRHQIFRKSNLDSKNSHNAERKNNEDEDIYDCTELTNTQELIGTKGKKCIFGMLCELHEGKIHLQDTSGSVQIDLSNVKVTTIGLFTFNCFVLCDGYMNNNRNVFQVETIGHPPYEKRKKTIKSFNNLHFLPFNKQQIMMELEQKSEDDTFVFLSNVYLDDNETFNKLIKLFDVYSGVDVPPTLFIFMGNFTKKKLGSNSKDMKYLGSLFDKLCDLLINKYHNTLCKASDFIFIPGPNDQLIGNLLPQPSLIPSLCKQFIYNSENGKIAVHFQSNPFRIRFGTQEIVCFRQDLLQKMRRNCVIVPDLTQTKEPHQHLAKTILDQSHLCPLPIQICPMYWNYSHSLNLYPSPHLIVLGDTHDTYKYLYQDCQITCPGNFSISGDFIYYMPSKRHCDFSNVNAGR